MKMERYSNQITDTEDKEGTKEIEKKSTAFEINAIGRDIVRAIVDETIVPKIIKEDIQDSKDVVQNIIEEVLVSNIINCDNKTDVLKTNDTNVNYTKENIVNKKNTIDKKFNNTDTSILINNPVPNSNKSDNNDKNATKHVATILTDKNAQNKVINSAQQVLTKSADMFLEAQNVLKTPGNQANAMKLQETARHISKVMKELEKTYIFGAPGQEKFVSALNIMKHATKELQNPSPISSSDRKEEISTIKNRLTTSTMEIAQLAQDIVTRSHSDPEKLDSLTPKLAQQYHKLTSDVNTLLAVAVDEDEDSIEIKQDSVSLGKNIVELIEQTCIQQVLPGHERRQVVAGNAGNVAEPFPKFMSPWFNWVMIKIDQGRILSGTK